MTPWRWLELSVGFVLASLTILAIHLANKAHQ